MGWLQTVRITVLSFSTVCAIIVGSLSAHITAYVVSNFEVTYNFALLGLITGGLAMITLPVMLIVDLLRTGAFSSLVVVELIWLSILWVLFLATGALTANDTSAVFERCAFIYPILTQLCNETKAIEAFSFLAFIALFIYTLLLLIVALVNTSRGAPIWRSTVRERGAIAPGSASAATPSVQQQQYNPNGFAQGQQYPYQSQMYAGQQPPAMQQYQPQQMYGMPNPSGPQQPFQQQQPRAPQSSPSNFSSHPQV